MRPRLHLVGLPHTRTNGEQTVCAFTTKAEKFCEMMTAAGWEIVLYWGDENTAPCAEHVPLFTREEQERWYGDLEPNALPTVATFNAADLPWQRVNVRAAEAIKRRAQPRDLVLLTGGNASAPLARAVAPLQAVEWAAGYEGWFADYVCFESHAWMHHCYGRRGLDDGRWMDVVIPNFFRPRDFRLGDGAGGYLLYLGRLIRRKGITVAHELARAAGLPLAVAGSGAASYRYRTLVTQDGCELDGVEYVGTVGGREREALLRNALALLAPTTYVEPFGAVAVEAQLCGTPAITTDWGAFPETVPDGFRFRTLQEGLDAIEAAHGVNRSRLRRETLARFSLQATAPRYERWLLQVADRWEDGWYQRRK